MTDVKPSPSGSEAHVRAALIGDVIDSREAPDRERLHHDLVAALSHVQTVEPAIDPPAITGGDGFQAGYDTVGNALNAAFLLRLDLLPDVEVRFGIGWGGVSMLDPERGTQDGPAWWAARTAIDQSKKLEAQAALKLVRTSYRRDHESGPGQEAVNAALACRDHMVGSLDARSLRILGGLVAGRTKVQLATAEQISPSAVSQRSMRDGLDVIVTASAELRLVR